MGMAANPILSASPAKLRLSEHVRFRVDEGGVDRSVIHQLATSPNADYQIDPESGHYVFRTDDYRIVMQKGADGSFLVLAIIHKDQLPL